MNQDNFTIRPLQAEDEPVLWIMLYLAIHVPPGGQPMPLNVIFRPDLAKYARRWGGPHDTGFAAYDAENLPVGAAWLRLLTGKQRGYGWIDDAIPELSVAVMDGYRGRGLGSRLIKQLLDAADARYPGISLSVSPDNPAANLYRRLGFRDTGSSDGSITMLRDNLGRYQNQ
jgi:ribosomal protein S18 acetylase RimI-like enzyme